MDLNPAPNSVARSLDFKRQIGTLELILEKEKKRKKNNNTNREDIIMLLLLAFSLFDVI
jgi:hypothetical protein